MRKKPENRIKELAPWASYGTRDKLIGFKVTRDEKELCELRAMVAGFSTTSDWIRHLIEERHKGESR